MPIDRLPTTDEIMSTYYSTLLIIFGVIAYMIVVDQNVAKAFILVLKIVKSKCSSAYLYLWLHPKNPFFKYLSWRRSWKLAKELQKEFEDLKQ